MTYRFICEKHEDGGWLGWRPKSNPGFDPLGGMTVAHDVLEHFRNGDDSPADEFLALGACLFTRRNWHAFKNLKYTQPGDHIGSDFPEIYRHILHEGMGLAPAPVTLPCEVDDQINIAIRVGTALVREVFGSEKAWEFRKLRSDIRSWMRIGYRRAVRRYRGWSEDELMYLFENIANESDKELRAAMEGDELTVRVCIKTLQASVDRTPFYEVN